MVKKWLLHWRAPLKQTGIVCDSFVPYAGQLEAVKRLDILCSSVDRYNPGNSAIICGAVINGAEGVGCTTMAVYALRKYAEMGLRACYYLTMTEMLTIIATGSAQRLRLPFVLVIDNFDMQGSVAKFSTTIMNVLQQRVDMCRPTIIVTRTPRNVMREWHGGAFATWAAGSCAWVHVDGDNLNKKIKQYDIERTLRKHGARKKRTIR